jgi:hypothetical protein
VEWPTSVAFLRLSASITAREIVCIAVHVVVGRGLARPAMAPAVERWIDEHLHGEDGALPPSDAAFRQRFR